MILHLGTVDANSTLYIPFHTFNSSGASVTITGLATTDIEIYKNGSTTQRASDNGYALLDTDGIDFDGITGIHGISIDLSDNSDSGFYASGSFYWVVISSVTIDSQTVNFVAATFRIGTVSSNVTHYGGTAGTFSGGRPEVNTSHIAGSAVSTSSAQIGVNVINAAGTAWNSGAIGASTLASDTITAAKIAADAIGASELAADAVTEIQSGLATAANQTTILSKLLKYFQLALRNDAAIATDNATELTAINADGGSGAGDYDNTVQANERIGVLVDQIDSNVGTGGANLAFIPWNAAWDAEVQSEANDALVANNLDHLVLSAVDTNFATTVHLNSVIGQLADNGTSATFDRTTDSLEAIKDSAVTTAQVNAEVVDALATDTYAEPGQGTPAATTTLAAKINYLYKAFRNRITQTSTTLSIYADDATTVDHKATVSDDGTTYSRGEIATGP